MNARGVASARSPFAAPSEASALSDGLVGDAHQHPRNESHTQRLAREQHAGGDGKDRLEQIIRSHLRHRAPPDKPDPQPEARDPAQKDGVGQGPPRCR